MAALRRACALARRAADPSRAALVGAPGERGRRSRSSAISSCSAASGPARARQRLSSPSRARTASRPRRRSSPISCARPAATCRWAAISAPRSCRSSRRPKNRVHVIEMSSFQIDLTPSLRPSVGVLLNVSPGSSRSARHHGALRRHQGAAGRPRRDRGDRHRRRDERRGRSGACRWQGAVFRTVSAEPGRRADVVRERQRPPRGGERSGAPSPTLRRSAPCAARTMRRTRRPPTPFARILGLAPS